MADFSTIIQEINDDINTNGVGAITGAKLNEVLRDMIAAVNAEKQDTMTIDATPTEDSTNPVQSGGVYDALEHKPTIFFTPDIMNVPPTILNKVKVGDVIQYGDDAVTEATVAVKDEQSDIVILVYNDGMNVGGFQYQNGVCFDAISFGLTDMANKVSGATNGNLAGLAANGDLTDSGYSASDFATAIQAVPSGGTTGQVLAKKSNTNNDLEWVNQSGGGTATDVQVNGTSITSNNVANIVTNTAYNASSNKIATMNDLPSVPVTDVTVGGTSVVTNGVAVVPSIPDVSGKADKVSNATNGNFAGLDGNGNLTDSGKKSSDFATPIPVVDASTVPASMDADKLYDYGTLSADIIFPSLNTPSDATNAHVFWWTFKVPATAPNVGWPASGITEWSGGSPPDINASTTYEIMVNKGFASYIMST